MAKITTQLPPIYEIYCKTERKTQKPESATKLVKVELRKLTSMTEVQTLEKTAKVKTN